MNWSFPGWETLSKKFDDVSNVLFPSLTLGHTVSLAVSEHALAKHKAIWTPEGILMGEAFYDTLRPLLDPRYFVIQELDL